MADAQDVRRLALALDGVEEIDSDGFDFRVGNRGFVWSYPERVPGKPRVIRTDVAVLYVGDEAEKQALLQATSTGIAVLALARGGDVTVLAERLLTELLDHLAAATPARTGTGPT